MRIFSRKNQILIGVTDLFIRILFFPFYFLRRKQSGPIKKILVIEIWGIGDLAMMSSVIGPLRQEFPKAELCLLSKGYGKELLSGRASFDRFFIFEFPWTKFKGKYKLWRWHWKGLVNIIRELRREQFDLILDARGDLRNNLLSFFVGAASGRRIGFGWTGGAYLLTNAGSDECKARHRVEAWKELLRLVTAKDYECHPFLDIDESAKVSADAFLKRIGMAEGQFIIGIHPGARMAVRRWPLERFIELAGKIERDLKVKVVFFKDPDINAGIEYPLFEGSLNELMAMISRVGLFICNDTGVMHIATALKTPVVAIFGPGEVETIGPYGQNNLVVRKENVKCRSCWDYCRYPEAHCLLDIKTEDVFYAVKQMLSGKK